MTRTLFRLAARNTGRRRTRTLLTAAMVLLGVALLMVALTWIQGVFGQLLEDATALGGHVRIVDREYAAREAMNPLYANLPDVAALAGRLRGQAEVVSIEPRIAAGVTVTVGQEIGDVFALAVGASASYFERRLKAREHLVAGRWFSGAPDELIAGARVAEDAKAKVGDEVVLVGLTQDGSLSSIKGKLVGIAHSGSLDRLLLLPLSKLQWLADLPGGATELLVFGHGYARAPRLAQRLRALDALKGYAVQAWDEREPLASMTRTLSGIRLIVMFAVVLLAALGIWNTMTTSVLERTREIGVLRAMGLSRAGAVALLLIEALAISIGGGVAGLALGTGPSWLLQHYGIRIGEKTAAQLSIPIAERMHGLLTWEVALFAFGLGLAMALVGSAPAALRAAGIRPVTAMRSGR